jgi:outer membrane protein TolC
MDIVKSLTQAVEDIRTLNTINKRGFENGSVPADEYTRSLTTFGQLVQQQKTAEMNMTVARLSLEEVIGVKLEEVEKEFIQN